MAEPRSRVEAILNATINGEEYNSLPQSRMEYQLLELKEAIEEGGGGGGGTMNYEHLHNLPTINGTEIKGEVSDDILGLVEPLTPEDEEDVLDLIEDDENGV